jgi:penicillin G amidase
LDKFWRTLGIYKVSSQTLNSFSQEYRNVLQWYCNGINTYIANNPVYPVEYRLLNSVPSNFTPADLVAFGKVLSYQLSANMDNEITYFTYLQNNSTINRLLEFSTGLYPFGPSILTPSEAGIDAFTPQQIEENEKARRSTAGAYIPNIITNKFTPPRPSMASASILGATMEMIRDLIPSNLEASNNWVIHGSLTDTGKPYLNNDPHLSLSSPGVSITMHLQSPNTNVMGASFPLLPGIAIGRTNTISWGISANPADAQDIFVMSNNSESKTYLYQNTQREYTLRKEVIKVYGWSDQTITVKDTIIGPIVNELYSDFLSVKNEQLALNWSALEPIDTSIESFYKISKATNFNEFKTALGSHISPILNFVYADNNNNIGYVCAGKAPLRKPGHSGMFPVKGDGTYDFNGYMKVSDVMSILNPAKGYIVTANNRVTPPGYINSLSAGK